MAVPKSAATFWLAAIFAAAGCAGAPNLPRVLAVQEGQRTTVRLMQFGSGQTFTLQNRSSGRKVEVYSNNQYDLATKVVADAQLQALLDVFAEHGLFAGATHSVPPEARSAIVIRQGERRYVFHDRNIAADAGQRFRQAQAYFLSVYNNATAYHSAEINRADLEAEKNRANSAGAATKQKHGRGRGHK